MSMFSPILSIETTYDVLHRGPEDDDGTPKEKTPGRKRGAAASPDGETPTKKGKTTQGKGGKAKADDEEAKGEIKQDEGSEDELA